MKKLLAVLLAVAMMASLSAVAFAATIGGSGTVGPATEIEFDTAVASDIGPSVDGNDLYGVVLTVEVLDDTSASISKAFLDEYYKFSYKVVKGADAIKSVKVIEDSGAFVEIKTNELFKTGETDIEIDVKFAPKQSYGGATGSISDTITATLEYDVLTANDSEPIADGDLFLFNVAFATATDLEFDFDGLAYFLIDDYRGDRDVLVSFDTDADEDIEEAYDAALSFLNIKSTSFGRSGTLYILADDDQFLYENVNGKLVASDAKYDEDEEAFIVKGVRALGSYVLSDKKLEVKGGTVTNPETGANNVIGIAAALAVVSLVAAGAVSLKK